MRLYSFFSSNGRNGNAEILKRTVPPGTQKKAISLSILDTIETTVLQLEKNTRLRYQKRAIMFGYVQMSNGKILGEKYNRLGHRVAALAKRFNINYE